MIVKLLALKWPWGINHYRVQGEWVDQKLDVHDSPNIIYAHSCYCRQHEIIFCFFFFIICLRPTPFFFKFFFKKDGWCPNTLWAPFQRLWACSSQWVCSLQAQNVHDRTQIVYLQHHGHVQTHLGQAKPDREKKSRQYYLYACNNNYVHI
jgi:hypothetical protein